MTEPSSMSAPATPERGARPVDAAARLRLGPVTTTTLVHRRTHSPAPWWRHAVVYEVPAPLDVEGARVLSADISHIARLGADALQIRVPDLDPAGERARVAVDDLIHRAHQRGLRVIAAVAGYDAPADTADAVAWHTARAGDWLARGADGIDLLVAGPVAPGAPHTHAGVDVGALQALLAERDNDSVLAGAGSALDTESLVAHLHEDWLHISRDDRLTTVPWLASAVRATISDSYVVRDTVGAPAAWTLSGITEAPSPQAWAPSADELRRRVHAATLLMLALPGVTYLRQGEEVGLPAPASWTEVSARARAVADATAEQKGVPGSTFERFRQAMRLRHELRLGTGPLAWVDDPPGKDVLAFLNRNVLVLVNLGAGPVHVPFEKEILHASQDLPLPVDGEIAVPGDTTVWIALE
ncbi:hypothetical protein [Georgenia sp. SYP-B2076]|uniref:hypothetical protein n=1 Tax=Georgenia sp. SYP-B2076 TaxID=2495881 RepID=UPI000F8EA82D|nr:hypothetical protein [Georgenia sp. SYP-B2076]